jgi:hypothetical protein
LLASILLVLAWVAEAMHGEFDPEIVYGVEEPGVGLLLSGTFLEEHFPDIEVFATSAANRGLVCGWIYGCSMSLEDVLAHKRNNETREVDRFAKRCNLGTPRFMLAAEMYLPLMKIWIAMSQTRKRHYQIQQTPTTRTQKALNMQTVYQKKQKRRLRLVLYQRIWRTTPD